MKVPFILGTQGGFHFPDRLPLSLKNSLGLAEAAGTHNIKVEAAGTHKFCQLESEARFYTPSLRDPGSKGNPSRLGFLMIASNLGLRHLETLIVIL